MVDIIDDVQDKRQTIGIISKASFFVSIILTARIVYSFIYIPIEIEPAEPESNFHYLTFLVVLGGILAFLSVYKKENNHWIKWTGGIINTIWFALMIISMIMMKF